jgi:hypothetical protein
MKTLLLNLWAWVLLHPAESFAAVLPVLVALATVVNARAKGAPASWLARFVDRLAVRTRADAANAGWSWPMIGRSVFNAALDASVPQPIEPRETQAPPPPSEPGYVESWVLVALVVAVIAALAAGCSGGSLRDALRFNGVREVRHPIHGDCIEASLTVTAESINRSGTGYLGVCRGVLDAGAVGDAGGAE